MFDDYPALWPCVSHSTFLFDVISIALCHMIFAAKTLSWIQKRTRIPETPYPRGETLAASSLCWRKHRVSLRNKDGESLMMPCSKSPYTLNYFSCISPGADTVLAGPGSVRFLLQICMQPRSSRSQSQQRPCGKMGTQTLSNSRVFFWFLEVFSRS